MSSEKSMTIKRIVIFTVLTVAIAWAVFLLVPALGLAYGSGMSIIIVAAAMFVPALGSILTRLITKEGFRKMYLRPNFKGHGKAYLVLFFGPTLLILLGMGIYFLVFPGTFDPELTMIQKMSQAAVGLTPTTLLLVSLAQVVVIGPVVNIIPTLGEELGWRGYLLPKLREIFPDRKALVITGVIWGLWHLPVIVMGHNYGTGYAGYPWLGILMMTVFCVSLGIIEGYATIKLGSAIPAAMIHSTVNAGAGLPVLFAKSGYNALLGPSITGLIGGIPFIVVAIILFIKIGGKNASRGEA